MCRHAHEQCLHVRNLCRCLVCKRRLDGGYCRSQRQSWLRGDMRGDGRDRVLRWAAGVRRTTGYGAIFGSMCAEMVDVETEFGGAAGVSAEVGDISKAMARPFCR